MIDEARSGRQTQLSADVLKESRTIKQIESLWRTDGSAGEITRGDDCAILRLAGLGQDLLVTSDQVVENTHFVWGRHSALDLGRKALVRSLSDIAAMGGWPLFLVQTVCLPVQALQDRWHEHFQEGLRQAATEAGVPALGLLGGDVSSGDRFVATVTLIGRVETGGSLLRSGAKPGDRLFVSGFVGGSEMGLRRVLADSRADPLDTAVRRHCAPEARLALGRELCGLPATAAIDISDGLGIDLGRLASASGVAAVLEEDSVPLFPGASLDQALASGEEYELLFTLPANTGPPQGADVTAIGWIEPGDGVWLQGSKGRRRFDGSGFNHFPSR